LQRVPAGALLRRLLRLLAHAVELATQLVRLARALVQQGVGLARRHRLDAARAGPDRPLGEDRERPDLGGRAYVRPAAQLARPTVPDLHHAHDVALLLG